MDGTVLADALTGLAELTGFTESAEAGGGTQRLAPRGAPEELFMSLDRFRRPRMIVLHPTATAYEAARAMAEHEVGSVLVADELEIVGIVTDRDLVLELVAGDLDPHRTLVADVMSRDVVTLDVSASLEEVTRLMRDHTCRRIPILEDGHPVGMVTLDDLLVDGEFAGTRLVVAAQLDAATRRERERAWRRERESGLHAIAGDDEAEMPPLSEVVGRGSARRARSA